MATIDRASPNTFRVTLGGKLFDVRVEHVEHRDFRGVQVFLKSYLEFDAPDLTDVEIEEIKTAFRKRFEDKPLKFDC